MEKIKYVFKQVYEVDGDGFLIEIYTAHVDNEGNILEEDKQGFVTVDYPPGLIRKKWLNDEWIEGASEEEKVEREAQQVLDGLIPTAEDLADADLEIKMITLLMDMEVI